jgi:hypothetical protein
VSKPPHKDDLESVAKRLGCDLDQERFKEKLGKIARAKPKRKKMTRRTVAMQRE